MALKTLVKVGKITNLSDARYCAGMGADMLGFRILPGDPDYLSPTQFEEMRGWFAGPDIVAELYGFDDLQDLDEVVAAYKPDILEFSLDQVGHLAAAGEHSVMIRGDAKSLVEIRKELSWVRLVYAIVDYEPGDVLVQLCTALPVLVAVNSIDEAQKALALSCRGIALNGSHEERPGLKDYGMLSDILESLEK